MTALAKGMAALSDMGSLCKVRGGLIIQRFEEGECFVTANLFFPIMQHSFRIFKNLN